MNLKKNDTADFHRLSQIKQTYSAFIRDDLWFHKYYTPELLK
jgi:hypothetical protein